MALVVVVLVEVMPCIYFFVFVYLFIYLIVESQIHIPKAYDCQKGLLKITSCNSLHFFPVCVVNYISKYKTGRLRTPFP
jgi:hypothetical protein